MKINYAEQDIQFAHFYEYAEREEEAPGSIPHILGYSLEDDTLWIPNMNRIPMVVLTALMTYEPVAECEGVVDLLFYRAEFVAKFDSGLTSFIIATLKHRIKTASRLMQESVYEPGEIYELPDEGRFLQ